MFLKKFLWDQTVIYLPDLNNPAVYLWPFKLISESPLIGTSNVKVKVKILTKFPALKQQKSALEVQTDPVII